VKNTKDDHAKKKTETITFRLLSKLVEELKKEAELEKINLNAFVSKILTDHMKWGRYERKVGLLPMTKPFVKDAINRMTEEEIVNLAHKIEKDDFTNILVFTKGDQGIDEFIEILRSWLNVAYMQHYIEKGNDSFHFTIQHDLGNKWSLYVKTMISELAHDVLGKKIQMKTTDSTISLVFPLD
jgi:hypothetical protein